MAEQKKSYNVQDPSTKDLLWEVLDRLERIEEENKSKRDIPQGWAMVIASIITAASVLGAAYIGFSILS